MSIFKEQKSEGSFNQKWITGPVNVNNVLINPTLAELKEFGVNYMQNEPVYIGDTEGVKYVDIVFYAKSVDDPAVIINWKNRISAKNIANEDKSKFINDKGSTSWAESIETLPEWFKTPGTRKALQGEEEFYSFAIAFSNIKFPKDNTTPFDSVLESEESLKSLFKGDFKNLKVANTFKDNKLKVIVGLTEKNDKYYHSVYNKVYFKSWIDGDKFQPYLYESKEKKGSVAWDYYINYLTNVDTNSRFNPIIITTEPKVWVLADIKKYMEEKGTVEPTTFTPNVAGITDDLPF
jgi:hypothetical protein